MMNALESLFDALEDFLFRQRPNSVLWASFFGKGCWATPMLLCPNLFSVNDYYRAMSQVGPQWAWLLVMLALCAFDLAAIHGKGFGVQTAAMSLGAFFWFFLGGMLAMSSPHGLLHCPAAPGAFVYGVGGVLCFLSAIARGVRARRERVTAEVVRGWNKYDLDYDGAYLRAKGLAK